MPAEYQFIVEIKEQPQVIRRTLSELDGQLKSLAQSFIGQIDRVILIGCGDPHMHSIAAAYALEAWAGIPAEAIEAAEFSLYRYKLVTERTLVILISSSGKTVKVIDGARLSAERGARLIAVTNVEDGPVTHEATDVILTRAGKSDSFPTKPTTTALASLLCLALHWGELAGNLTPDHAGALRKELVESVPAAIEEALKLEAGMKTLAEKYVDAPAYAFIGSGPNLSTALLAAAKIKETNQGRAEGCNLEEFAHLHTLSVKSGDPVFIITVPGLLGQRSRRIADFIVSFGAHPIAVGPASEREAWADIPATYIEVPQHTEQFGPLINWIPLQIFAYYLTLAKGLNPDRPVNRGDFAAIQEVIYTSMLEGWTKE